MIRSKSRTLMAAAAVTTLAVTGLAFAQQSTQSQMQRAQAHSEAKARSPEVIMVVFHADWCPNCKTLGPKMMKEVFPEIKAEPYLLVKLDLTDRESNQAEYMLSTLGLGNLWEEYGRKTGFALLVDTQTKEVLHTFTANTTSAEMVKGIKAASAG